MPLLGATSRRPDPGSAGTGGRGFRRRSAHHCASRRSATGHGLSQRPAGVLQAGRAGVAEVGQAALPGFFVGGVRHGQNADGVARCSRPGDCFQQPPRTVFGSSLLKQIDCRPRFPADLASQAVLGSNQNVSAPWHFTAFAIVPQPAAQKWFTAGRPVPGIVVGRCGVAHAIQLPHWIDKMRPSRDLCKSAAAPPPTWGSPRRGSLRATPPFRPWASRPVVVGGFSF